MNYNNMKEPRQEEAAAVVTVPPAPPTIGMQWCPSGVGSRSHPHNDTRTSTFPLRNAPAKLHNIDSSLSRVSRQNKPATISARVEVELIRVVKPINQILNIKGCTKEEWDGVAANIDMQRRTNSGRSGLHPSIDQQKRNQVSIQNEPTRMPAGYIPSDLDVYGGRGPRSWNHAGNIKFRQIILASGAGYAAAPRKSAVVVSVIEKIRRQGGHFLREQKPGDSGYWYDIGDVAARIKVASSLRDRQKQSQRLDTGSAIEK
jgi:hypothetical protein